MSKLAAAILTCAALLSASFCGTASAQTARPGVVPVVAAENFYGDVVRQLGGNHVQVTSIMSNPDEDPHLFEASPKTARALQNAALVVYNGADYDPWMDKLLAASKGEGRTTIVAAQLMGKKSGDNPHLWYDPKTMPAVAKAVAADLSALNPAQAAYFEANVRKFDASLKPWLAAIASFKAHYPKTPVAVTEPVADYMLELAGTDIATPFSLQSAIMNGTDPSPQDVTKQNSLFADRKVKVFVYNQQVTDALTQSFLSLAKKNGIPVMGVYETMPTPGFTYQSWMLAEVNALEKAVTGKVSTETLQAAK